MEFENKWVDAAAARIESEMTDANKADWGQKPKMAKGGVFAPADIKLIKDALVYYVKHNANIEDAEERQAVNLLHRLNNRI